MPSKQQFADARDAVKDVLDIGEMGLRKYVEIQKIYFQLEFERLAREDGLQGASFDADRYNLSDGTFRSLQGVQAPDPDNPFTSHAVTIDHIVDGEGSVECEINGVPLPEVGARAGSHIR